MNCRSLRRNHVADDRVEASVTVSRGPGLNQGDELSLTLLPATIALIILTLVDLWVRQRPLLISLLLSVLG